MGKGNNNGGGTLPMDWLLQLLFGWWWYGHDGRTKAADAADHYIGPLLLVTLVACLLVLLIFAMR